MDLESEQDRPLIIAAVDTGNARKGWKPDVGDLLPRPLVCAHSGHPSLRRKKPKAAMGHLSVDGREVGISAHLSFSNIAIRSVMCAPSGALAMAYGKMRGRRFRPVLGRGTDRPVVRGPNLCLRAFVKDRCVQ